MLLIIHKISYAHINKYQTDLSLYTMQQQINRKVYPGQKLCKHTTQSLGYGLYSRDNSIYSSAIGSIQHQKLPNSQHRYFVTNNLPSKRIGLCINDTIYGKIVKVKQEEAIVEILQVNQIACINSNSSSTNTNTGGKKLQGAIRKQNVREKMVDSVVMIECFKPRDIVKVKVISLGDSLRGIYLTTAAQNLGVLVGENQETGRLMLPFDWTTMVDPEDLIKEPRKVCKPE